MEIIHRGAEHTGTRVGWNQPGMEPVITYFATGTVLRIVEHGCAVGSTFTCLARSPLALSDSDSLFKFLSESGKLTFTFSIVTGVGALSLAAGSLAGRELTSSMTTSSSSTSRSASSSSTSTTLGSGCAPQLIEKLLELINCNCVSVLKCHGFSTLGNTFSFSVLYFGMDPDPCPGGPKTWLSGSAPQLSGYLLQNPINQSKSV